MKYNLEKFDKVINDIITNPNNKWGDNIAQPLINDLLKKESVRFKREIRSTVFRLESNEKIEHYIHKQQLALENLIAVVVREINPNKRKHLYKFSTGITKKDQLKIVYLRLEKLQIFFEKEYLNYLNLDRCIPYRSLFKRDKEIASKIDFIRKCKTSVELSIELLQKICKLLRLNNKKGITYNQFNYSSEFTSDLYILLSTENRTITDEIIIYSFFVEMDYNTKAFFKFQTRKITEELESFSSENDKRDYLFRILKNYNQIGAISRFPYNKKRISHREQIVNWVEEEINYMSQNFGREQQNSILKTALPENKSKILLNFSVAQVSYFFNLMHSVGIIKHKNQRDIFRFIAENFKTSNTENISTVSISSKYYNPELGTQEAVKSKVIEMLNILKKQN